MGTRSWGESFLKSGLPLEHFTLVTLKSLGFMCASNLEYLSRDGDVKKWRELDVAAEYPEPNGDAILSFLVECKYHDLSRFWFFLPCESPRWQIDRAVFNFAPVEMLVEPRSTGAFDLAPLSTRGLVVAEDGTKQDNAVRNATRQIAGGFVARSFEYFSRCLDMPEGESPWAAAVVPMIVTNAKVFRLRTDVVRLEDIREATRPSDIADEVGWTWCSYDSSMESTWRNVDMVSDYLEGERELLVRHKWADIEVRRLPDKPSWIAVVNLDHLAEAVDAIRGYFMSLPLLAISDALERPSQRWFE